MYGVRQLLHSQHHSRQLVVLDRIDFDRLESCLSRLAERERMIVLLTFYAERSARQVGEEMTMTEGNVRVTRHRAIGRLRACMSATGGVQ